MTMRDRRNPALTSHTINRDERGTGNWSREQKKIYKERLILAEFKSFIHHLQWHLQGMINIAPFAMAHKIHVKIEQYTNFFYKSRTRSCSLHRRFIARKKSSIAFLDDPPPSFQDPSTTSLISLTRRRISAAFAV
jgi:hypothetical protein